jgi:O-acetylserine/cysteine efflux transporter
MRRHDRHAVAALAAAGILWGATVALSKLTLTWLGPEWLTVARFALAAPVLALVGRRHLREALTARVLASGALGFGAVIELQNAGLHRTSVSHAALVVGTVPVLVALISTGVGRASIRRVEWVGCALALAGIAFVAGGRGGGASSQGDLLVLASAALSAAFIVMQPSLLAGRDAAAVTAVQFAGGGLAVLPLALLADGLPPAPVHGGSLLAFIVLAVGGTCLPFWLFAWGQVRVPAQLAGVFVNLEPVVGAALGWLAFGDAAGAGQLAGALAVVAGILLSALAPAPRRRPPERSHRQLGWDALPAPAVAIQIR